MAVSLRDDGNITEGQYCHGRHLPTVHHTRRDEQHVDYTAQVHAYLLHTRQSDTKKRSRYLRRLDTMRKTRSRSKSGPNTTAGRRYGPFCYLTVARVPDMGHFSSVSAHGDGRLSVLLLFSETAS